MKETFDTSCVGQAGGQLQSLISPRMHAFCYTLLNFTEDQIALVLDGLGCVFRSRSNGI